MEERLEGRKGSPFFLKSLSGPFLILLPVELSAVSLLLLYGPLHLQCPAADTSVIPNRNV